MSRLLPARRHRRALVGLMVVAVASVTTLGVLLAPGGAVTSSSPSTNVNVTFTTPITNLTDGSTVGFDVTTSSGETLNGDIESRICDNVGAIISNTSAFGNSGGRCVDPNTASPPPPGGLVGAQYLKQHGIFTGSHNPAAAIPELPVSLTHNVGTGTVQWFAGSLRTLTCNSANPCRLVVKVNTNGGAGVVFFSETLQFAAPPAPPSAPVNVSAVAGDANVLVSWDKITVANPAVTSYNVSVTPNAADPDCAGAPTPSVPPVPQPAGPGPASTLVSPLVNACEYSFTVTGVNAQGLGTDSDPVLATPVALARFVFQTINVTRPEGALVLTQACAGSDPYPDTAATGPVGDVSDVVYGTNCTVDLGTATLVQTGTYAGQYFTASGAIREITIVDTRDTDDGWTVNGVLNGTGNFVSGSNQFSGKNLGWTPSTPTVTPPIPANDIDPGYTQAATAGGAIAPITQGLKGTARNLATALAGQGLGIAKLNAGLSVMIPIFNQSGLYTATLQITAI